MAEGELKDLPIGSYDERNGPYITARIWIRPTVWAGYIEGVRRVLDRGNRAATTGLLMKAYEFSASLLWLEPLDAVYRQPVGGSVA